MISFLRVVCKVKSRPDLSVSKNNHNDVFCLSFLIKIIDRKFFLQIKKTNSVLIGNDNGIFNYHDNNKT